MAPKREQLVEVPLREARAPFRKYLTSVADLDLQKLKGLALLRVSQASMAREMNVAYDRWVGWMKTNKGGIADVVAGGVAANEITLRKNALELSKRNATVLIFLMKNELGMKDGQTVEVSGPNGAPLKDAEDVIDTLSRANRLLETFTELRRNGPEDAPEVARSGSEEADRPEE